MLAEVNRVHTDRQLGRGLYGIRKVHAQLTREGGVDGRPVSRRQVERLMRAAGLQGAGRAGTHWVGSPILDSSNLCSKNRTRIGGWLVVTGDCGHGAGVRAVSSASIFMLITAASRTSSATPSRP